jgi:hypothetical protein
MLLSLEGVKQIVVAMQTHAVDPNLQMFACCTIGSVYLFADKGIGVYEKLAIANGYIRYKLHSTSNWYNTYNVEGPSKESWATNICVVCFASYMLAKWFVHCKLKIISHQVSILPP